MIRKLTREQRINEVKELIANAEEWAGFYEHPIHDKPQREMFEGMAKVMSEHLAALSAMDSEPVAWSNGCNKSVPAALRYLAEKPRPIGGESSFNTAHLYQLAREIEFMAEAPLYRHAQQSVVDADDNFYSWFGREWQENYQHNQYTTAAKQMLGVMAESAWKAGRHAAMLQGAENADARCGNSPVIPDGYNLCLVPMEHTEAFHAACTAAFNEFERGTGPCGVFIAGHRAMLAAAPQPQNAPQNIPEIIPQWIPVSERMPEDAQWCAVITKYGYYVQCWSDGQGWLGVDISIPNVDVTHWMPLPAAPAVKAGE